jgi:prevent-host-death family protein
MTTVNIKEAKNRLSELGHKAENGETIVVTRHGKPAFDLVPHRANKSDWDAVTEEFKRKRGIKEIVTYVADDFDDPLPEDFLITPLPLDRARRGK